jgi:DNA adenine methylase
VALAKVLVALASRAAASGGDPVGRPFLKWAGGKGQLLGQFEALYPRPGQVRRYIEPFLGGGAVFFHVAAVVRPSAAILSDSNEELIDCFKAVRDEPEAILAELERHAELHDEKYFYQVRDEADPGSPAGRAARMIYLNKTCFNGLYRVNSKGLFNVPSGKYVKPRIIDRPGLLGASAALRTAELRVAPFTSVLEVAEAGDFVYFDPPYDPVSKTANFTAYTRGSFGPKDQRRLAEVYAELAARGCLVMLSNSDTPLIKELYRDFLRHTSKVSARRNINRDAEGRGVVAEVVVRNYKPGYKPARGRVAKVVVRDDKPPRERKSMVRLTKIYTKAGDKGQTRLVGGQKVAKDSPRLECYGTVDELSSCLGLARAALEQPQAPAGAAELNGVLRRIQNELFNLGSELATLPADLHPKQPVVQARHVQALEHEIDAWNEHLPHLESFILPGGGFVASYLHLARTICRRAERLAVALAATEPLGEQVIPYLNRLSDALFVMSRHASRLYGEPEPLWEPEKT